MARRHFGRLPVVIFALCAWAGCKDKGGKTQADVEARCEALAKTCGDKDKRIEKMVEECKVAASKQVEKGCADKAVAAYECYEKELCGKGDKVWTLDDLSVLADRQSKCVAQRDAVRDCVAK